MAVSFALRAIKINSNKKNSAADVSTTIGSAHWRPKLGDFGVSGTAYGTSLACGRQENKKE